MGPRLAFVGGTTKEGARLVRPPRLHGRGSTPVMKTAVSDNLGNPSQKPLQAGPELDNRSADQGGGTLC